jgi:cytochrome c2
MKFKTLLATFFFTILFACSTKSKIVSDEKPIVSNTNIVYESTERDMINKGSTIFQNKCGNCHDMPKTSDHSLEAWKPIMNRMQKEAQLSDQEKEDVLFYISRSI